MSSSDIGAPKVRLRVRGADETVHITVVGADLRRVGHGVGALDLELPPGIYAARFQAGGSVREQRIVLRPERGDAELVEGEIAFRSPVPLARTRTLRDGHARAAQALSRTPQDGLGSGGALLVFVRDLDRRGRGTAARGLTLHRAGDGPVADLEERAERSRDDGPAWAGCTLRLDPGAYLLRSTGGDTGPIEQTVVVAEGWQTQVFLARRGAARTRRGRRADLAGAAVLMARVDTGFDPAREDLRATEIARLGLRDQRNAVRDRIMRDALYRKWDNPMLGLYGAHLMLQRSELDEDLLAEVIRNLRELLGEHPDVMALRLRPGDPGVPAGDFAVPPMLHSSWDLVVRASVERPELVPGDSLSAASADRVLAGAPWLSWRPPERGRRRHARPARPAGSLAAALAQVAETLPSPRSARDSAVEQASPVSAAGGAESPAGAELPRELAVFGGVEADVLELARKLSATARLEGRPPSELVDDAAVVAALAVPRAVAEDAIDAVAGRLAR